jgi:hypothetical protein
LLDASPVLDQATAVSLFQDALRDADPLVGEAALRALLHRDSEQNRILSENEASRFQGETAELAKVHFAAIHRDAEALRELMRTGDAVVQESAFNALAAENTSGAIEDLKAEFDDRSSLHRLQSLELFLRSAYTSSPEVLEPLLRAASDDEDPLVSDYARDTLKDKS